MYNPIGIVFVIIGCVGVYNAVASILGESKYEYAFEFNVSVTIIEYVPATTIITSLKLIANPIAEPNKCYTSLIVAITVTVVIIESE